MVNDMAIMPTGFIPSATNRTKPSYLVVMEEGPILSKAKNAGGKRFITLDKPEQLNGFIQAKGFFTELSEDEISLKFNDLLTNAAKELILELMIPWHKISYIRSLVYKQK